MNTDTHLPSKGLRLPLPQMVDFFYNKNTMFRIAFSLVSVIWADFLWGPVSYIVPLIPSDPPLFKSSFQRFPEKISNTHETLDVIVAVPDYLQ